MNVSARASVAALAAGAALLVGATSADAQTVADAVARGAVVVPATATVSANARVSVTHSTVVVGLHGNGHGHGLSQYGAQGAAVAGKSYRQILAFYYPHTVVHAQANSAIRVRLSGAGRTVTFAPRAHSVVTGVQGALPTAGVRRYRLAAGAGATVVLQRLDAKAGAAWRTVAARLPNGAQEHRTDGGATLVYRPGGTSREYRGALRAVRLTRSGAAGGVYPVDVVTLDQYTAGVVPREMPISWRPAAVEAQAVAARSYGRYAVKHPRGSAYDICDTTACQVYGGKAQYGANGHLLWTDAPWAASATSGQILQYAGKVIFAEFSASNGGWTVAGGKPYLVAERDPFDGRASGDPYLAYRRTVATSALASHYGLAKITAVQITKRDGHGADGGRVLTAVVTGRTAAGATRHVATDGADLGWALGVGTTWFTVSNA
jgi:peptidoglycan hydrolase-like amidase